METIVVVEVISNQAEHVVEPKMIIINTIFQDKDNKIFNIRDKIHNNKRISNHVVVVVVTAVVALEVADSIIIIKSKHKTIITTNSKTNKLKLKYKHTKYHATRKPKCKRDLLSAENRLPNK